MATEQPGQLVSFKAAISMASHQYKFVKMSANDTVTLCTATTDIPVGIIQNAPGSLAAASVMVQGVSKLVGGGSLTVGALVGTDAAGLGTLIVAGTSGTVAYPVAQVLSSNTAANGIATVLLGNTPTHSF